MKRTQDLERLSHAIKDAEARLKVFTQTLSAINKELSNLSDMESAISENMVVLKSKHIVALAAEFRNAKENLASTKNKMLKIRIDSENILRATKDAQTYLDKCKQEYADILRCPNNILVFKGKNAKE